MEPVEVIIKKEKKPWYKNNLVVIPILLFFPYIGIPWMWKFADYSNPAKVILTGIFFVALIIYSSTINSPWLIIILIVASIIFSQFIDSGFRLKGGENVMIKKIILGIIGFFVVIGVIGAITGNGKKETTSNTPASTTSPNQPTQPAEKNDNSQPKEITPKVGDVTKLGDREFVVNSVKRSRGFNYNTPKSGKEYVIVNVTIRNLGKDEVSYNPFDFKVQDANGAQESETFATLDDSLSSGTLAPGGKVTGSMPFEVPIGDNAKLIFQPSFWSSQRIVVELGNK